MLLLQIYVAGKNKMYVGLHVNCMMLHWNNKSIGFFMASFRTTVWLNIVMIVDTSHSFSVFVFP
jgi:hypothetical protein